MLFSVFTSSQVLYLQKVTIDCKSLPQLRLVITPATKFFEAQSSTELTVEKIGRLCFSSPVQMAWLSKRGLIHSAALERLGALHPLNLRRRLL